jgi:hypothetical protein
LNLNIQIGKEIEIRTRKKNKKENKKGQTYSWAKFLGRPSLTHFVGPLTRLHHWPNSI